VPQFLQDITALQALFDDAPDAIMVEQFDPPLAQSTGDLAATEFPANSSIFYANPTLVTLCQNVGVVVTDPLTLESFERVHKEHFDETFRKRWRLRVHQPMDNMQVSRHYQGGTSDVATMMMSTTPITQDGYITGCSTRITDVTQAVTYEADERRALKQIDAFMRTENTPLMCVAFSAPLPMTLPAQELGSAYYAGTITHATDAVAELFRTTPTAMLDSTIAELNNARLNDLLDSAFPASNDVSAQRLTIGDTASLVVEAEVNLEQSQTYRVKPTFVFEQGYAIEAWIRLEDVTSAELEARERQKMQQTRALAMSAASLHQFESKWLDGELCIDGPDWDALGIEALRGDLDYWKALMNEANMSLSKQEIDDVFSGANDNLNFILRLPTKAGEELNLEVWGVVNADENGKRVGNTFGLFRDVTENEKLRSRLREKKTLEGLGVLAGGVAHDFNNILMSVLGYAELMEADLLDAEGRDSNQLQQSSLENISEIRTAALRASDLCTSLLAYAGQHLVEKKTLNLTELVRSAAELVDITIAKRVPVVLDLGGEIPISADRGQITRVLINLIGNAADAMEGREGSVQLKVSTVVLTPQERVLLRDQLEFPEKTMACITVTDSGCGMDRATQQRIYEPFFTTKDDGRGLGMAAVHGIIRHHGGGILLHSVENEGTEFKVCLPLIDGVLTAEQPAAEAPKKRHGSPRVIVVDDEAGVRTIAAEMLRHLNCEVAEAASAEAALALFANQQFDYALLDITMPVMSGTELAELLLERLPKLKVVLCSGYTDRDLPDALLARCTFIHKPFTLKEISDSLELERLTDEQDEQIAPA